MLLNVARWIPRSAANGPGERFVLWVQGCSMHCPGCWNPDTWSTQPKSLTSIDDLWLEIKSVGGLEGVTFTGGEPFDQAGALAVLGQRARTAKLSLVVFTGYDLAWLTRPEHHALLAVTDLLVAGPYQREAPAAGIPLLGSTNQKTHFLSARYNRADLDSIAPAEILLHHDGSLIYTGFPPPGLLGE